jgi:hypothetical protein
MVETCMSWIFPISTKTFSSDPRILIVYNEELYEVNLYPDLAGSADAPGSLSVSIGYAFWGVAVDVQSPSAQHAPHGETKASEYVAVVSIKSNKHHFPSCNAAKKIKPENEIWLTSSEDARANGYMPCGICNPP